MLEKERQHTKLPIKTIVIAVTLLIAASVAFWLFRVSSSPLPSYRSVPSVVLPDSNQKKPEEPEKPAIDWQQVDQSIVVALLQAKSAAETTATKRLDAWNATLMQRVDRDFLDWYFSYWTQQKLGITGAWRWTLDQVIGKEGDMAEHITEKIQEEFAWRVLRPNEAQRELQQIAHETLEIYSGQLQMQLAPIPAQHQIPQQEWEGYLQDIAVLTSLSEGNRHVPLSLKAVTAGSVGGGVVLAAALAAPIQNLGSKTSTKLAAKAASQMASKTGAKVASRAGGKLLGLIIGIGIVVWEVWDHEQTRQIERPKLRQAIVDYFEEMQKSLLYDPESGMVAMLDLMEGNVVASLRTPEKQMPMKARGE